MYWAYPYKIHIIRCFSPMTNIFNLIYPLDGAKVVISQLLFLLVGHVRRIAQSLQHKPAVFVSHGRPWSDCIKIKYKYEVFFTSRTLVHWYYILVVAYLLNFF